MLVGRRTFLIGLGAVLATPALGSRVLGKTAKGILPSSLEGRRWLFEFAISSMAEGSEQIGEDPVRWTFYRDDSEFYAVTLNWRAMVRWVAVPGGAIEFAPKQVLRVVVEPCHTVTTLSLGYNLMPDRPLILPNMHYETFRWKNGTPELRGSTPASLPSAET